MMVINESPNTRPRVPINVASSPAFMKVSFSLGLADFDIKLASTPSKIMVPTKIADIETIYTMNPEVQSYGIGVDLNDFISLGRAKAVTSVKKAW